MPSSKLVVGLRVLAACSVLAIPATALAHIRWVSPAPRSQADGLKPPTFPAPCGAVPRGTKPAAVYQPGATIDVKWLETIGHVGCFQIAFSADDVNFVTLSQITDTSGGAGTLYPAKVTLPAGVSCKNCTLQLRQIMLDGQTVKTCAPDAAPPNGANGTGNTYYSCADICVGADCQEAGASDAGPVDTDSGPGPDDDGGPTTTPTDGGGKLVDAGSSSGGVNSRDLNSGASDGGCSVAFGATSGVSFVITAGLLGLALARRRRRTGR